MTPLDSVDRPNYPSNIFGRSTELHASPTGIVINPIFSAGQLYPWLGNLWRSGWSAGWGYTTWRVEQWATAQLWSLSDRTLKDIGLNAHGDPERCKKRRERGIVGSWTHLPCATSSGEIQQ